MVKKKKGVSRSSVKKKKTVHKKHSVSATHHLVPHHHSEPPTHNPQHVISRTRVYNLTRDIPSDKYFVLANGKPVKNVAELAALLDQIEDHVFDHHVTPDRNDFHNWVKDVFEDMDLARKITGINDKKHMQLVIYRHIAGHD